MDVKTFRASSIHEALRLVRREFGPDASVLHTREMPRGLWNWLTGSRDIEVTASPITQVPSRFAAEEDESSESHQLVADEGGRQWVSIPALSEHVHRTRYRSAAREDQQVPVSSMVEQLCQNPDPIPRNELPDALFALFTDLIEAEISEELARELLERVRTVVSPRDLEDSMMLRVRLARLVEDELRTTGPIVARSGECRIVAMVGPTGVGKTTTIAKLAANQRLREQRRVGLITVDTYRIAAVEQLRTYADIMDLPMEVVATPREMRTAIDRFRDFDLVLMDTAGRSPKDEVRIQELRSLLHEAQPREVHLVVSSVSSEAQLRKTAEKFAKVGVTSLLLTKLDEATGLGNLLPLVRSSGLPISYVTNGQNVPADIEPADRRRLARVVLGLDGIHA